MHYLHNKNVGNHGGRYVDEDGMSRQFTYIDHDKKEKFTLSGSTPFQQEWDMLEKEVYDTPIFHEYLSINGKEWGVNVNLGDLRAIYALLHPKKKGKRKK